MNDRRKLLIALGAGAWSVLAMPLASFAQQQTAKIPHVGFLAISGGSRNSFLLGLRELGYVDERNISIEYRSVEQINAERLGFSPTGKRRPFTAHASSGPCL